MTWLFCATQRLLASLLAANARKSDLTAIVTVTKQEKAFGQQSSS